MVAVWAMWMVWVVWMVTVRIVSMPYTVVIVRPSVWTSRKTTVGIERGWVVASTVVTTTTVGTLGIYPTTSRCVAAAVRSSHGKHEQEKMFAPLPQRVVPLLA